MVIFEVKRPEKSNHFFFSCSAKDRVAAVMAELCRVHNMRLKVLRTAACVTELAKHGPLRPEETRGVAAEVQAGLDVYALGAPTAPDEYNYRTGMAPPPEVAQVLLSTAGKATSDIQQQLLLKKPVDGTMLEQSLQLLRGCVMIAYPGFHGLPAYDPARVELEDKEELDGQSQWQDAITPDDAALWWAGKLMERTKVLSEHVGKNEKTKVVVRLQSTTLGAPMREPRIDEDTHKTMLSYYYKKQEENKKLVEDDDDSYLQSEWAAGNKLKSALVNDGRDISFRPA